MIMLIILCYCFVIIWRIIEVHNNPILQNKAIKQMQKVYIEKSSRGQIFDTNGKILASEIIKKRINIDSSILQTTYLDAFDRVLTLDKKPINFLNKLADILQLDKKEFNNLIAKKQQQCNLSTHNCDKYEIVKKDINFDDPIIDKLTNFMQQRFLFCKKKCITRRPAGVFIEDQVQRFYPQADSAAAIIGVVNSKNYGVFGIEKSFNKFLTGENGKIQINKANNSWDSYYDYKIHKQAINGKDLHLTIDSTVQFNLFNAIKDGVIKKNAKAGSGIIINKNGEILAIANYPASNPNNGINSVDNYSHYLNRALASGYDVASTIKPLVALIALDKNTIKVDDIIDLRTGEGKHFPAKAKYPELSVSDILRLSYTLGSIKIAKTLSSEDIYNTWVKLGFGSPLGILPDIETSGTLKYFNTWSASDKTSAAFGYGPVSISIAQLARAYLVFANAGAVVDLNIIKSANPKIKKQIFSAANSKKMIKILEQVVAHGTAKKAQLNNIIAAGKTGTARRRINGAYSKYHHNAFFAGFAPSQNPKYIVVISIEDPRKGSYIGGNVAAPIFKNVMDKLNDI